MSWLFDDPLDLLTGSRMSPGWRPEDVIGESRRGRFLPLTETAGVMALAVEDVLELVEAGLLQTLEDELDGRLLIEPAIVSGGRMLDVDERTPRLG
jgi:hypothetical protein